MTKMRKLVIVLGILLVLTLGYTTAMAALTEADVLGTWTMPYDTGRGSTNMDVKVMEGGKATIRLRLFSAYDHVGTWTISKDKFYLTDDGKKTAYVLTNKRTLTAVKDSSKVFKRIAKLPTIKLNKSSAVLYLRRDKNNEDWLSLRVTVRNCDGEVAWKSSNPGVATVEEGVIFPKKAGTTKITATITDDDGDTYKATCKITVKKNTSPITKITPRKAKISMGVGDRDHTIFTFKPATAYNNLFVFSSSDPKIVAVDEEGTLTAKKKGTATITIKARGGSKEKAQFTVVVK